MLMLVFVCVSSFGCPDFLAGDRCPRVIAFLPCFAPLHHGSAEHLHHAREVGNFPLRIAGGGGWAPPPPPRFFVLVHPLGLSFHARVPVRRLRGSGAEDLATNHPWTNYFVVRH